MKFRTLYEILAVDQRGNWTKRLERVISVNGEYKYISYMERTIKYKDEYEVPQYMELAIDTFILNGKLITDPEVLNPRPKYEPLPDELDEAYWDQKHIYDAVDRLHFIKYLSDNYFFNFSTHKEDIPAVLEDRLLYYYSTLVFDLKSQRKYKGSTKSNRWFEKTNSYQRLEQMESAPLPTENWLEVNGYNCRIYEKTNAIGKTDRYYVTEELPFVNYSDFTFTLPGLVMKADRYIDAMGETKVVIDLTPCEYPFHFLEHLQELNEKFGTDIRYAQKQ